MSPSRLRALAGVAVLSTTLGLAACGERAPQPATDAPVTDAADSRTTPSEAERAQQSGMADPGPAGVTPDATSPAGAPPPAMLDQLAGLGGAMHAAVELCDPGIGPAQLAEARERQQQEFVRLGGDVAVFDREFTSAHDRVRAQYTSATPAQQQQMCDELEAMAQQAPPPPAG